MADIAMTAALAKALGGGGGGGGGGVEDVKVNGTSVVQDGVANVPVATDTIPGVMKARTIQDSMADGGLAIINDIAFPIGCGNLAKIKAGSDATAILAVTATGMIAFFGLARAAGADMKNIQNVTVGTYPEAQKSAISQMLNAPETVSGSTPSIVAKPGVQYVCGEVSTIDITVPASGIIDVIFESGSTPAVLTVTPPTGMTMKWAGGFDPTSLEANTTYEINVMNGCLGVAGTWT